MGLIAVLYSTISYVAFLGSFSYAIGFVGNLAVSKTINSGVPPTLSQALLVNVVLLALFAIQHSVMARPAACSGRCSSGWVGFRSR